METKLRTTYKTGNATIITDYCGNAIYENGVLIKVLTEDGYITVSNNQFHYFIQDHQGNNRVVVTQNGVVEEVNDYIHSEGCFLHHCLIMFSLISITARN